MAEDLPSNPKYKNTMERLEALKRVSQNGSDYWFAREIQATFGYADWPNFRDTIGRAGKAMEVNGEDSSHHIVATTSMLLVGNNARREGPDMFLSRGACYFTAMNGDSSKPEIAAAQSYFASQTRSREIEQQAAEDGKRLEKREKVTESFKVVSGVAKSAGVKNRSQSRFHDARYVGLYGQSARSVKGAKGIDLKENHFDRMGALELSAHEFQMNLAAETIEKYGVRGEDRVISKNREIAGKVRDTMIQSGSRPPEELPAAEPIKEVVKRVKSATKKNISPPNAP